MDDYCDIGEIGICEDCGEEVIAVECLEEVPDLFGCQKHYYIGSPCCGAGVIKDDQQINHFRH